MKIYNKWVVLWVIWGIAFAANAQQRVNDQRTNETKIVDIAMQLPAKDTETLNRLMRELIQLDNVIPNLASKLLSPGQGDDSQLRAAISGLALYASQGNNLAEKEKMAGELCTAIQAVESDEIKDFLLIQLQYVAGDESIETAALYLDNARLADAAARVLIRVGGDAAGKALITALEKAINVQRVTLEDAGSNTYDIVRLPVEAQHITLVQALGDMRYKPAAGTINALITNSQEYHKVMLHSLAQIADLSSERILSQYAQSVGYNYEPIDAFGSYVLFLKNSLPDRADMVAKSAQKILKATSENSQIAAKSAALELYIMAADEKKAIKEVMTALKSNNKQYRQAALNCSATIKTSKMHNKLKEAVQKEKRPEVKAEIITFFGVTDNKNVLPFVLGILKDKDYEVVMVSPLILVEPKDKNSEVVVASLTTAGKLGQEQAVIPIVTTMKNGTQPIVDVGMNALLTIKSDKLLDEVANAIPQAKPLAKVAFMKVLAARRAVSYSEVIFAQTLSNDDNVRLAACKALAPVVAVEDVPRIAQLLNKSSNKADIAALQQALFAAVSAESQDSQTDLIVEQAAMSGNLAVYGNVMAMIGGEKALDLVMSEGFNSGQSSLKRAAVEALINWSDDLAIPLLYKIAVEDRSELFFEKALTAYITKTGASKHSPEQKLILLRNALDIAHTLEQKASIIYQIERTGTFLGLITIGKLLDDKSVQHVAVQSVISIALAHPEYYGKVVTELLYKAMELNYHPEASYQKQAILKHLANLPQDDGFVSMFNGKDLTGWKGLVENPIARSIMKPAELANKQEKADEIMRRDWIVKNGLLVFTGKGYENICSEKMYGDFELYMDWRIDPNTDSGIYLRGSPQVQIWDTANKNAEVGSGGLFNNQKYPANPLVVADNPAKEWNSFYIRMEGDKVTVYLNGRLVTDHTILENYWDRSLPIFEEEAIELQAHTTRVEFRDIYVREMPRPQAYEVSKTERKDGFVPMFNGINMTGWIGNLNDYFANDGMIVCDPTKGGYGNLYTEKEYSDFVMRFEFLLTPAANNGLGIRAPLHGDAAYVGMELQILDDDAEVYKDLHDYQYHGSVYGVIPAKRGYLKPVGEWNCQEVIAKGNRITITLNGTVILDGDLAEASKNFTSTVDGNKHPGLSNTQGHIGFLGHGSWLAFKNLRIKEL